MAAGQWTPGPDSPFPYDASVWAPVLLCVLFGIAWVVVHIGQAIRFRTLFMWVILVGSTIEWLGYMFRIFAIVAESASSFLVVSQTFLIVSPALLVGQCYIIIERMMTFVGKEYGFTDHNEITKVFLGADIIAIGIQAIGSSVLTDARGDLYQAKVAKKILVAGLLLQIITFGIYSFFAVAFDFRSSRDPALLAYGTQMKGLRKLWIAFYVSAVLITLRSIYRAVGRIRRHRAKPTRDIRPRCYFITHKWSMYVFDAIPVLIFVVAFSIWHPGAYLPTRKGLHIDGTYDEQPGWRIFRWLGLLAPRRRAVTRVPVEAQQQHFRNPRRSFYAYSPKSQRHEPTMFNSIFMISRSRSRWRHPAYFTVWTTLDIPFMNLDSSFNDSRNCDEFYLTL